MNRFARTLRKIGWGRNGTVTRATIDADFDNLDELVDMNTDWEIDLILDAGKGWVV